MSASITGIDVNASLSFDFNFVIVVEVVECQNMRKILGFFFSGRHISTLSTQPNQHLSEHQLKTIIDIVGNSIDIVHATQIVDPRKPQSWNDLYIVRKLADLPSVAVPRDHFEREVPAT